MSETMSAVGTEVTYSETASSGSVGENSTDQSDKRIRDSARQLSIILVRRGINCRLVTSNGISINTVLRLSMSDKILSIFWRSHPEKLGCELMFLKSVTKGSVLDVAVKRAIDPSRALGLIFGDLSIQLEASDAETCDALHLCLETLLNETKSAEREKNQGTFMRSIRETFYQISVKQEQFYQQLVHLRATEGALVLDKILNKSFFFQLRGTFDSWTDYVCDCLLYTSPSPRD